MYDIIFIGSKSSQYNKLKEKYPTAKLALDFDAAKAMCFTKFFWAVWPDVDVDSNFVFDYKVDDYSKDYVHIFKNRQNFDGICLFPKRAEPSNREIDYRFFTNKKEVDVVASLPREYQKIYVTNYDDYVIQLTTVTSEFVWVIPNDVIVDFDFDYQMPYWEKDIVHVFKNRKHSDGIYLHHKDKYISKREYDYRFFTNKKEIDIVASKPVPYDIVFISYNESNADENYAKLTKRFPRAKRVHGVKGIHQAHVEAAKLCNSDMFWVVDADAEVVDDFEFDYYIPAFDSYSKKTVHVWKSKNPINNLEYGNGGIKLLPRTLTINVDVNSTDMTTSISTQFKSMDSVSNINRFDTDPFNVWKSAFRECCKLASKTIRGQVDNETEQRLKVWCEEGLHTTYGRYAVSGACSGRDFGYGNRNSPDKLNLINDFDWLYEQFQRHTVE